MPNYRTGKICYIELPTDDVNRSVEFYRRVFGWNIRTRGDGSTSFDDAVEEVSGTWVLGRPPARDPHLMVYIMAGNAQRMADAILAAGGEIVKPIDPAGHEVHFTFRDPYGNLLGVYQQPGLEETEARGSS